MFLFDPRPWKIPVPFVGMVMRSFAALILLANANPLYDKLEILGSASFYIYLVNLAMIAIIFTTLSVFAAQRLRNYAYDSAVSIFTFTFSLLWAAAFIFNAAVAVSGFVKCHAPGFQKDDELKYCYFFGNHKLAKVHGWDGKTWPTYYWISFATFLIMSCWQ
ncbi:hypothetical protein ACHAQJ_010253, partial [Trichoderma viride]